MNNSSYNMSCDFDLVVDCNLDSGAITCIKFCPKGEKIGISTSVGQLFIFETLASEPSMEFPPCEGPINQIAWKNSTTIFSVTESGSVWKYNIATVSTTKVFSNPSNAFLSIDASLVNNKYAVGSTAGDLFLLSSDETEDSKSVKAHSRAISGISFRGDGEAFITGSHDSLIRIWNRDLLCTVSVSLIYPVTDVKFQPSGKIIYAGCSNGTFKMLNSSGGTKKIFSLDIPGTFVTSFAFMYYGGCTNIVIGISGGLVLFFSPKMNTPHSFIQAHSEPLYAIDFHQNKMMVATGGGPDEMNLKLWKYVKGDGQSFDDSLDQDQDQDQGDGDGDSITGDESSDV
ncbi:hypothetical protein TRFO_08579 [Tritrichomonas foetus]|uniref:Uncharacterized protein n=1 Tax=Tritrichomonas foetus TaxID=1144522 RepID=A0A1J4JNA6_9EUKA|nr:hypothetical protein TRFO_08579 [Tritrichomonas foetus]|eukprot:OHS99027.1 hypothetical protein TRFO_08579 [Tritrichomonas foetus]